MASPRLAEYCARDGECADLRVNGDRVALVSVEQVKKFGWTPLVEGISSAKRERQMPADVRLPRSHVMIHDVNGVIFSRCEIFIVRWLPGASRVAAERDIRTARAYFGDGKKIRRGHVEVPERGWLTRSRIEVIRYHRDAGPTDAHIGDFEHRYDPPIRLYVTRRPLAWKLGLPNSCVIDAHGFVRP